MVNQVPDCLGVADALRKPFVVAVDGFMHDTAMLADVILPPAFMFEREDALGSFTHNCVNHCAAAVPPPGLCRPDFEIMADLGARLADPVVFPDADTCLAEGLKKADISLEELREHGFVKVSHPPVAFKGMVFAHPDGLYRFPEALSPEPERDPEYPLHLLTLVRGESLHSQIPEADQAGFPTVWISRDNPAFAGLNPAMDAYLATPAGAMRVTVETVDGPAPAHRDHAPGRLDEVRPQRQCHHRAAPDRHGRGVAPITAKDAGWKTAEYSWLSGKARCSARTGQNPTRTYSRSSRLMSWM